MYLTVEDLRYDMVSEVDYSYRLMNATVRICTPNRTLVFMGWNHGKMRALTNYVQQRVMEIRQQHMFQQTVQRQIQPLPEEAPPSLQPVAVGKGNYMTFPTPSTPALPTSFPPALNPYTKSPLMIRRRSFGFKRH
jgi:hypothetical protein